MFLGCGTNSDKQETKSQNIIFTKEVIEEKDSQELSLLQVTVANNEKAQEIASMYESIDVCSNSNCFRTDIISDPKDTTIADIAISDFSEPLKYISYKKYDESLYDAHFYYLPKEINLTKGSTHKLYLAKDTNKNTVAFKPSLITLFSPLDKPFLYTPKKSLEVTLKDSFKITVEKNTFDKILTLNISSKKNNDISSKYYLGLAEDNIVQKKEMNILIPLNDSNLSKEEIEKKYEVLLNNEVVDSSLVEKDDRLYFKSKINRLGFVEIKEKRIEELPIESSNSKVNKTTKPTYYKPQNKDKNITHNKFFKNNLTNCLNRISYWKNWITYYTELNGYTLFNNCSKIEPGLFIVSLNTDNRYNEYGAYIHNPKTMKIELAFSLYNTTPIKGMLKPIVEHAKSNKAEVAINGFTWDVGLGRSAIYSFCCPFDTWVVHPPEYAKPLGKTFYRGRKLSSKGLTQSGTTPISLSLPNIGSPKIYSWKDGYVPRYPYNLYSSSTTILHKGKCNPVVNKNHRGVEDKWSAIGIKNGKMLMLSSNHNSGITTNTYEMCQIFKAFGYDEAIRQDGSTAASLVVGQKLINPLVGAERTYFHAPSRKVLYGITAKVQY